MEGEILFNIIMIYIGLSILNLLVIVLPFSTPEDDGNVIIAHILLWPIIYPIYALKGLWKILIS